ncbi:MAG: RND family transporter, partial [Planctomycetaceae bacterium]
MPETERSSWLGRWNDSLIRNAKLLMVVGIGLIVLSGWISTRLTYQESIESLYAPHDPHLLDFLESKDLFGGDELIMVAYQDPGLLTPEGLERNRELARRLSEVDGVIKASTQSIADALSPQDANWIQKILLRTREDEITELFRGVLLGLNDDQTTAVVLRMQPLDEKNRSRSKTFEELNAISQEFSASTVMSGEPLLVHETFRYIREDSKRLFFVSLTILGGVLMFFFHNLRWVMLPLLIVWATIVIT